MNLRLPIRLAVLASLAFTALATHASDTAPWPTRPLTFVVPFTPGGITDNTSRLLAHKLSEKLGQQVIVDNRPGAGGSIGVDYAVRQPADGYTLIYGTQGTHAANLALYKNVRYDPVKDFAPVHGMSESPLILVAHPSSPFNTVAELVAYAKAHPDKINFGSAGQGTGTHLTAEIFQNTAGIEMTHVPYKGSSPVINDLVAGNLDIAFDYPAVVLPFLRSGKLKALAVTSKTRLPIAPELLTMGELGYPEAQTSSWAAVFVAAQTPSAIVQRLSKAVGEAIMDPEIVEITERNGGIPMQGMDSEKLGAFVKSEVGHWRGVVERSNATLN